MEIMNQKKFDWQEVHRRLENVEFALEHEVFPSHEKIRSILKTRAQALASNSSEEDDQEIAMEVIEFILANERYGIETTFVREVYSLKDLTPIPCVPSFVLGIVNIRGEIISVIDLRRFFELPITALTDLNKAIVLSFDDMTFGILADEIIGTKNILTSDIQPPLVTLTDIREAYLHGIAPGHTAILDAQKLLAAKNMLINETVE